MWEFLSFFSDKFDFFFGNEKFPVEIMLGI